MEHYAILLDEVVFLFAPYIVCLCGFEYVVFEYVVWCVH